MKKISSKIIIFLLVTILLWSGINFGFTKKASAQSTFTPGSLSMPVDGGTPTVGNTVDQTTGLGQSLSNVQTGGSGILSDQAISDIGNGVVPGGSGSDSGSGWTIKTIIGKAADLASGIFFTGPIWVAIMAWLVPINAILAALTIIVAGIFDGLLSISMSSFGAVIDSSGINTAWTIIRDVLNVSFIFVLLYISISIILGDFGPKKKSTVAGVVISALLINYSMFITRVIIDFGNILAVAIYNSPGGAFNSAVLMGGLQIQTILSPDNFTTTGQISSLILMLIEMIMVCVFMATLFKGIIFMLGRLVALLALLALSPFGFVGFGIPWLKDKADEWWTNLVGQVFLLPVFLFFLMMTSIMLKAAQDIIGVFNSDLTNFSTHFANGSALANGNSATAFQPGQWIYFCLIIGMLHLSVKMTKKMAGKTMSDIVDKAAKGMKYAASAVIAVGASVATGGAAAPAMAARLGTMAAKGGVPGMAGRMGLSYMSKGANATKVFRQPGVVGDISRNLLGTTVGSIKDGTGLDIKGATKDVNDYQKNYNKYAGAEANRRGSTEVLEEEKKNREQTMEEIKNRAEARLGENGEGKKLKETLDASEKTTKDLTDKIAQLDKDIEATPSRTTKEGLFKQQEEAKRQLEETQKTTETSKKAMERNEEERKHKKEAMTKVIGVEMGYDMGEHERRMGKINSEGKLEGGEIEKEIKIKKEAQGAYLDGLKGYAGKKAARAIREAIKKGGKYEEKSTEQKWLDEVREKMKKDEKEKKEAENSGGDKEEKKEEKKEDNIK